MGETQDSPPGSRVRRPLAARNAVGDRLAARVARPTPAVVNVRRFRRQRARRPARRAHSDWRRVLRRVDDPSSHSPGGHQRSDLTVAAWSRCRHPSTDRFVPYQQVIVLTQLVRYAGRDNHVTFCAGFNLFAREFLRALGSTTARQCQSTGTPSGADHDDGVKLRTSRSSCCRCWRTGRRTGQKPTACDGANRQYRIASRSTGRAGIAPRHNRGVSNAEVPSLAARLDAVTVARTASCFHGTVWAPVSPTPVRNPALAANHAPACTSGHPA